MPSDVEIRPYQVADENAVVTLWKRSGLVQPQNDPHRDIARKLQVAPELFLVAARQGRVVGTVMAGYEGHRGWINYLAVDAECRRGGLGRQLMAQAEQRLRALGCPKINLQVRSDNLGVLEFYRRLGFTQDAAVSMGKRLVSDEPRHG